MSKPRVFLSIDLDYWGIEDEGMTIKNSDAKYAPKFIASLLKRADDKKNPLPLYIVESHEEMLPIVNNNPSDELWNVDFHSDFSAWEAEKGKKSKDEKEKPVDGDWVNFVQWAKNGKYVWIPPCDQCYQGGYGKGVCDPYWDPFLKTMIMEDSDMKLLQRKTPYVYWKKTIVRDGSVTRRTLVKPQRLPQIIPWKRLTAVAIAVSPYWLHINNMKPVLEMLGVYESTVKARKKSGNRWDNKTTGTIKPIKRQS